MARPSHVRDAVAALLPERHAWTVDEAHRALLHGGVRADRASVHRSLTRLCADGEAQRFEVAGRNYFELPAVHHEHAVCDECGTVEAVEGCVVHDDAVPGFRVTSHQVTFSGVCARCSH